jgi:hypothetical protein
VSERSFRERETDGLMRERVAVAEITRERVTDKENSKLIVTECEKLFV